MTDSKHREALERIVMHDNLDATESDVGRIERSSGAASAFRIVAEIAREALAAFPAIQSDTVSVPSDVHASVVSALRAVEDAYGWDDTGLSSEPVEPIRAMTASEINEVHSALKALGDWVAVPSLDAKAVAAAVLQSACETDPADPDHPDTIAITVTDLEWIARLHVETACERALSAAPVGGSLLRAPSESAPAGCYCKEVCAAPIIMGRQQPCRRAGGIPGQRAPKAPPQSQPEQVDVGREAIEDLSIRGFVGSNATIHGGGYYVAWPGMDYKSDRYDDEEAAYGELARLRTDAIIALTTPAAKPSEGRAREVLASVLPNDTLTRRLILAGKLGAGAVSIRQAIRAMLAFATEGNPPRKG